MKYSKKISDSQGQLRFRGSERRGILAYALPWERRLLNILGLSLLAISAVYAYFVMTSIVHVAATQELASKVALAKASASELETQYLKKTQNLTEAYAHSLGYVTVSKQAFIERGGVVTLKDTHSR